MNRVTSGGTDGSGLRTELVHYQFLTCHMSCTPRHVSCTGSVQWPLERPVQSGTEATLTEPLTQNRPDHLRNPPHLIGHPESPKQVETEGS